MTEIATLKDGNAKIVVSQVGDDVVFHLYGETSAQYSVGYVGTRFFRKGSATEFAKAILRVTSPDSLAPGLPTEEGVYLDADGDLWRLRGEKWIYVSDPDGLVDDPKNYLPFTRLVPETTS
ncbi:hypothetical protein N1031_06790 [Herbiconiux moechotypicola]|uniref:Uncharacterized protein n=1 Tax=Herbiconiux moechotypicola TaxID=637393 RepID=A0ABP5QAC5_9MICO|nr:hypothetical protein [Herbiconiux moechotypicola]MCS5729464.1 hypothetical protein [Herbiconiux moechotypicola]